MRHLQEQRSRQRERQRAGGQGTLGVGGPVGAPSVERAKGQAAGGESSLPAPVVARGSEARSHGLWPQKASSSEGGDAQQTAWLHLCTCSPEAGMRTVGAFQSACQSFPRGANSPGTHLPSLRFLTLPCHLPSQWPPSLIHPLDWSSNNQGLDHPPNLSSGLALWTISPSPSPA